MTTPVRTCQARRYGRSPDQICQGPPQFDVVYRSSADTVLDRHPACFSHGLAEVERHHASAGMARCDLEPIPPAPRPCSE